MSSKIYTKRGDEGTTALFGGKRVPKDARRIEAYGTVDELNSIIGVARSLNSSSEIDKILGAIQNSLFILGADLATPRTTIRSAIPRIRSSHVSSLEKQIDVLEDSLEPLTSFILPGGGPAASYLHFARTVCRRAERHVVHLARTEKIGREVVIFLNRLSDLLFVLARYANRISATEEVKWINHSVRRNKG